MSIKHSDLLIIGAGPVGLALALAVLQRGFSVIIIDRQELKASYDQRTLAISYANQQFLQSLNSWPEISTSLGEIKNIHISQQNGQAEVVINNQQLKLPALGYTVAYAQLWSKLYQQVEKYSGETNRFVIIDQCTIEQSSLDNFYRAEEVGESHVTLNLNAEHNTLNITPQLIVHAEGSSKINDQSSYWQLPYQQIASLFAVDIEPQQIHTQADYSWAWERFTPSGPLALLPGNHCFHAVMISNLPTTELAKNDININKQNIANKFLNFAPSEYFTEQRIFSLLQEKLPKVNEQLKINSIGPVNHFPLRLLLKKQIIKNRQVWIGNAAQTLHPVSGQGLNLGLRDVYALSELLLSEARHLNHLSLKRCLNKYQNQRRIDRYGGALFTDSIVRIFSNSTPILSLSRELALNFLAVQDPARDFIARRMIWGSNSL